MNADFDPPVIDLAREADFRLGDFLVRPSTRQVEHDSAGQTLEPRVMQVLVVLARRSGEVVSRDELIRSCWGVRAISEDAINRCISKVRKVDEAGAAFTVETIPRVGYRLSLSKEASAPAAEPVAAPKRTSPLLAVLAFDNLSNDADMAFFSDGISEEILQAVARRARLSVIGRASSFQFRGAEKAVRKVAAELGASHILDGSVRRSGDRVRITAQLIDAADQTMLWSERYDRQLNDVFALQDEIAGAIASALKVAFSSSRPSGPIDPVAYDLFLRGRSLSGALSPETQRTVVSLLEQCVDRAPQFVKAWNELAHARRGLAQVVPEAEGWRLMPAVREANERALALDPDDATARYWRLFASDEYTFERGNELAAQAPVGDTIQDGMGGPRHSNSYMMCMRGHVRDSLESAREFCELDPLVPWPYWRRAEFLLTAGELPLALEVIAAAYERWPDVAMIHGATARMAAVAGDFARADELLSPDVLRRFPIGVYERRVRLYLDNLRDPSAEARDRVLGLLAISVDREKLVNFEAMTLAAHLGGVDAAYDILERAEIDPLERLGSRPWTGTYFGPRPIFSVLWPSVRRDPRFVKLCARLGLVAYWLRTDHWPDCADEDLPYDFRAECRRVASERGSPPA